MQMHYLEQGTKVKGVLKFRGRLGEGCFQVASGNEASALSVKGRGGEVGDNCTQTQTKAIIMVTDV